MAMGRRKSFYSDIPERKSRNVERYRQLEARLTGPAPVISPKDTLSHKSTPPRRIQPVNLFGSLLSPSPPKSLLCKGTSTAVRSLRDLDWDSPSKNTRRRALFSPPEMAPGNLTPKKVQHSPTKRGTFQGASPARNVSFSPTPLWRSPRRIVLGDPLISPVEQANLKFQSPVKNVKGGLFSPVKYSNLAQRTPVKSPERSTPLRSGKIRSPSTPKRSTPAVTHRPSTPRRSHLLLSPKTPNRKRASPFLGSKQDACNVQLTSTEGLVSTPRKRCQESGDQMLAVWAEKALRQSPRNHNFKKSTERKIDFGPLDDTVLVSDLGLLSPPRKYSVGSVRRRIASARRINAESLEREVKSTFNDDDELASPLSDNQRIQCPDAMLSPRRSTRLAISPTHIAPVETKDGTPVITPVKSKDSTESGFTPPLCIQTRNTGGADSTPSRKWKGGRVTPEATSPLDKWPRRKPRTLMSPSPGSKKSISETLSISSKSKAELDLNFGITEIASQEIVSDWLGEQMEKSTNASKSHSCVSDHMGDIAQCAVGIEADGLSSITDSVSLLSVPKQSPENENSQMAKTDSIQCVQLGKTHDYPSLVIASQSTKRKRSPRQPNDDGRLQSVDPAYLTSEVLSKRRRTLRSRSTLSSLNLDETSGSQLASDYFDSPEVFIEAPTDISMNRQAEPRRYALRHQGSSASESNLSPLRLQKKLVRNLSATNSDSNSNFTCDIPSSPVFAQNKNLTHVQNAFFEGTSDTDNSGTVSPIFRKSLQRHMTDISDSSPPTSVSIHSDSPKFRKFSPSSLSLAHLIQSPLIQDSTASPNSGLVSGPKRLAKTSRRSLYTTETDMDT